MSIIYFGNNIIQLNDTYLFTNLEILYQNYVNNNNNNDLDNTKLKIFMDAKCFYNLPKSLYTYVNEIILNKTGFENSINLKKFSNLKILNSGTFNFPIDIFLPNSIEKIYLPKNYSHPVNNLPNKLILLDFTSNNIFNHPLNNLPCSLKILFLGEKFNQPIDNLPSSLIELHFDKMSIFNHSIDNLPCSLIKLTIGYNFSHQIDNLPDNLEYIKMYMSGERYDIKINKLPKKLKKIELPRRYKYSIDCFPDSIEEILARGYNYEINKLPYNIKKISLMNIKDVEKCIKNQNINPKPIIICYY